MLGCRIIKGMSHDAPFPLHQLPQLRQLLPHFLAETLEIDPSDEMLDQVFNHLRTLYHILDDYLPRRIATRPPQPGQLDFTWQEGTLIFTDLVGFTTLMEANNKFGQKGAETLLNILNAYFGEMIEIASKSSGDLLEFTGDALLILFPKDKGRKDIERAIRAGLRMQRAMRHFEKIETPLGNFSLGMRVGLHSGRFLTANIGTPDRMEYVLLGNTVLQAKHAESASERGRVCLTQETYEHVRDDFHFEPGKPGYMFVVDDLATGILGEYELFSSVRRRSIPVLMLDSSREGMLHAIRQGIERVAPLAAHMPQQVLEIQVESTETRRIPPEFPNPAAVFVNLRGLTESIDKALPEEQAGLVQAFSEVFTQINAVVEQKGGVLKKVTCHLNGSDMAIYFGTPKPTKNYPLHAAETALAIRAIVANLPPITVNGEPFHLFCQVGVNVGPAFSAEIGEPRGRREFNVLGDTINTTARLMNRAEPNQVLASKPIYEATAPHFNYAYLGDFSLKGKAAPTAIYALEGLKVD
ncbi:MAG: adenylate/guanylate cyclase domain-containing protein [Anaerolineales bacterium]|nr:adenylate/guanylate cyclase domain-containing protein [Anaerolineales bacterium]